MAMTWTVTSILVLGAAAGIGSLSLLAAVVLCSGRWLVRENRVGATGQRCPCCGYSTQGLEDARCPECGLTFQASWVRAVRRRRIALTAVGGALGLVAIASIPLADAARFGAAHAAPSLVLVHVLRLAPAWHGAITRELQARSDAGQLSASTSAALARACADLVRTQRDPAARRAAAWLLARVAVHAQADALWMMVEDRDAAVRADGVEAMRLSGAASGAGASERLNRLVVEDASAIVRKRAIDAMRYLGDDSPRARSTMLLALEDPIDGVRERALLALSESRSPSADAVRAVNAMTGDASEDVRQAAALTLGRMAACQPDAIDALSNSLNDTSPLVRACAAIALGEVGRGGTGPAWVLPRLLGAALSDEDESVRHIALSAIRGMRG